MARDRSGDEISAEVTNTANQVTGPPGRFLDQLLGPVNDNLIKPAYQDRAMNSRTGLGASVELREPGEGPKTLWANASHDQMFEIINSNADSSAVAVSSVEWVRLGNDLSHHQQTLGRAITDSPGDWQGDGGDAARTYLTEVAKWLGSTADGAVLTGRQQEIHAQALDETQKAMAGNPPVPFSAPEANARLSQIVDPVQFALQLSAEMDTFNRQQAARDQAAQVMHQFDETIRGSVTTPKFSPPPSLHTASTATTFFRNAADPTGHEPNLAPAGGATPERYDRVRDGGVPDGSAPIGNGVPGGGVPGGLDAPDGGAPDGNVPFAAGLSGGGVPGGTGPDGSVPFAAGLSGGGAPGGTGPGGGGFVPNGVGPGAPVPGGSAVSRGSFPEGGVLGGSFPGGGIPGGGSGGPDAPSIPPLPDFKPSTGMGPSGLTGSAGFTPPPPNVPELPTGATVPSGFSGAVGNAPGAGYVPPTFSGLPRTAQDGERTTRLPTGQQGRPTVPNLPGGGPAGGGLPGVGGRGFGPGGGVPPSIGGSGVPGGPRIGAPGSIPAVPGSSALGGAPGGGAPGGRGFGPMGGSGGAVGAIPGGTPGGPGASGGSAPGTRGPGSSGAPMGGGRGAGTGGGQGDDMEHQVASYLEGDSELFAPGQVVSPPVIGDWNSTQDWK